MTADLLEQYIALHEQRTDPEIVAQVAEARHSLDDIDARRAAAFIASLRETVL